MRCFYHLLSLSMAFLRGCCRLPSACKRHSCSRTLLGDRGGLLLAGPLAFLHPPFPLGQLPVTLVHDGLRLAVGCHKRLHIGIPLRLHDGGKCIQPAGDFLLRLRDLLREGLALLALEDTRCPGKLLLQVRQYLVLQVPDTLAKAI